MDRRLPLEGCLNFRDLGGYPAGPGQRLAWRRLFRSDALHGLTHADITLLQSDEVGLTDVVDLRSTAELESEGRGPFREAPLAFHHMPLFDGAPIEGRERAADMSLADRYFGLLDVAMEPVARVVEIVAGAKGASVYHCAAGKDRTGVVSAVILGVLGVHDDLIIADYALTQENLEAIMERLSTMEGYKQMLHALPPDTQHADPETMRGLLAGVADRWGDMAGYVRAAGVTGATVERLKARCLVPV